MKRKIITSIILFIVISLCMTFTKADNTIDVNNLDDIKDLIQSSSEGNVDIYDVLQAYKDLSEKIKQIDIQTCQNNFDEIAQNLYKELKIKENTKDMKKLIIDLLKILIIKEKVAERQSEIQNKNMYLNRGMRGYNPYVNF